MATATVYDKFEKLTNGKWRPVTVKAVAMDAASSRIDAKAADLIAARLLRNAALDDAADDALATLFPRLVAMDDADAEQQQYGEPAADADPEQTENIASYRKWYADAKAAWNRINQRNAERRGLPYAPVAANASKGR